MPTVALALLASFAPPGDTPEALRTVAERSDYKATARPAEVTALLAALDQAAPTIASFEIGRSEQGRPIAGLILADPPVARLDEVRPTERLVVVAFGNIHAGEVCGKEALPRLARELTLGKSDPLLERMILIIVPDLNPDGNERIDPEHREHQNGPEQGVGIRENAQGFDLNRDWTKLESPEIRAFVSLVNQVDPDVVIDTHATNGSHHQYTVTYDGPKHPDAAPLRDLARRDLFPELSDVLATEHAWKSFYYGSFNGDKTRWESYPAQPRFGVNYLSIRGHLSILSEAYAYAPYKDRVQVTFDFVKASLRWSATHKAEVLEAREQTRKVAAGKSVALRTESRPLADRVSVLGDGPGDERRPFDVSHVNDCVATLSAPLPAAYLIGKQQHAVITWLQRHGLRVEELREDLLLPVQVEKITALRQADRPFQKHRLTEVETESRTEPRRLEAGSWVVPIADQRTGPLAALLLEARSDDGLVAWNGLDPVLAVGSDYPIVRLESPQPLLTSPVEPLLEGEQPPPQRLTYERWSSGNIGIGGGGFPAQLNWIDEFHYLQSRRGRLHKVEAETGTSSPFHDPDKMAEALGKLEAFAGGRAASVARGTNFEMDPSRQGALINREDLYYARFDGASAVRLTDAEGDEEVASFSPDGAHVAFVRKQDLYVVDVATQTERRLTRDGGGAIRNGEACYVYYEEVFDRDPKAYWWSPDNKRIAYQWSDESPVKGLPVFDALNYESSRRPPWPRAGDPNPKVRLGVVDATTGGDPKFFELPEDCAGDELLFRVYWKPDGSGLLIYAQDRAQTRLDVIDWDGKGPAKRLFRETSDKGWVDSWKPPHWLADGSFLFLSERTGWRHLDHHAADGSLIRAVTAGEWAIDEVERVDEQGKTIYFTSRKGDPLAADLFRIKFEGGEPERVTREDGTHSVSLAPGGDLFIDRVSDIKTPTKTSLRRLSDGDEVRMLDANPARGLNRYKLADRQLVRIPAADGFLLTGDLFLPPDLDPNKKYPVYFTTYGGPRMPTVSDSWGGGQLRMRMMAEEGFIVLRIDPRTASDRSAKAAWAGYKRLGIAELADIEEALRWLSQEHPYADKDRVAIQGASYGGYLTAFALTHSKMFAAGVAEAPVTDWRDYDSIYTERYMGLPQENAAAYRATSAVAAANQLHGKLLLIHGGRDHNVPIINTMKMADALQRAGKDFEMMIYPTASHGGWGRHGDKLAFDFLKRTLGGPR